MRGSGEGRGRKMLDVTVSVSFRILFLSPLSVPSSLCPTPVCHKVMSTLQVGNCLRYFNKICNYKASSDNMQNAGTLTLIYFGGCLPLKFVCSSLLSAV